MYKERSYNCSIMLSTFFFKRLSRDWHRLFKCMELLRDTTGVPLNVRHKFYFAQCHYMNFFRLMSCKIFISLLSHMNSFWLHISLNVQHAFFSLNIICSLFYEMSYMSCLFLFRLMLYMFFFLFRLMSYIIFYFA